MDLTHVFLAITSLSGVVLVFVGLQESGQSQKQFADILRRISADQARIADHTRHIAELAVTNIKLAESILLQFDQKTSH